MKQKFSVIIPTYNAEKFLSQCIRSVRNAGDNCEIIVVDGASRDQTLEIACREGVTVFTAKKGRGGQLNAGAGLAGGDIFLFLHADTQLPEDAFSVLEEVFLHPEIQIGTFLMRFDREHCLLNFYSRMTKIDSLWTRFGDQCIVARKSFFDSLKGFPDWPLFEDVCFLERARKLTKIHSFPACVTTSSQRFIQNGILRQQIKNAWLMLQYLLGVPPATLSEKYDA